MPSTTARLALPIPLDSDPLANAALAVRNLGNALDDAVAGKARRGVVNATTNASGDLVVTHGLGATPTAVLATVFGNSASSFTVHAYNFTSTTFTLRFRISNTAAAVASTAGVAASWLAVA